MQSLTAGNFAVGYKKLSGFHHTGSLEVSHSLLLKYCPKRQHFSYVGMQAHIELAILDHNYNPHKNKQVLRMVYRVCLLTLHNFLSQANLDM